MCYEDKDSDESKLRLGDLNSLLLWLRGFGVDGKVDVSALRRMIREGEFDVTKEEIEKIEGE